MTHSSSEYGLGNRVNSLISAAAAAEVLGEQASYSWPQTAHLMGDPTDLFESLPAALLDGPPDGARILETVNLDDESLPFSLPGRRADFLAAWPKKAREVRFAQAVRAVVPDGDFMALHIRANISRARAVLKNRLLRKSHVEYSVPTPASVERACRPFSRVFVACDNPEVKRMVTQTLGAKALWFEGALESADKVDRSADNAFSAAVDMAAMCAAAAVVTMRPGYSTIRTLAVVGFGVPLYTFNPYRVV